MSLTEKHINGIVIGFFLIIIAVVFQQIATSMTEQGIASGSPYDNAAAYPKAVALIIAGLLILQTLLSWFVKRQAKESHSTPLKELFRPAALLVLFSIYLGTLGWLGYHLTTTPMIIATMSLCGVRKLSTLVFSAISISFVFAFLFEYFLKIVLPGGVFALNIPW